ncbi:cytochrome P450 [Gimesia sp.]|uniref:cytochrome P450 n=1 Tax=Gimesia sp. TaxID=2024833 RepID=UPI0032EB3A30
MPWYTHFFHDPLTCFADMQQKFGQIFAVGSPIPFRRKQRKFVIAFGPDNNRRILQDTETFRPGSVSVRGPRDSGLNRIRVGFSVAKHQQDNSLRKIVLPAFQKNAVQDYHADIVTLTNEVLEHWSDGQKIEIWEQMRILSGNLACQLLFGRESLEDSRALGESLQQFMQQSYVSPASLRLNMAGTPYHALVRRGEEIASTIQNMLDRRETSITARSDVLEMMVRTFQNSTDAEHIPDLVGPAAFLFVASFETVANAMTWTLFLLAQHPHIMAELFDELQQVLGGEAPSTRQLAQLPLLEATIKESLRILTPVPITYRVARKETELNGVQICSGDRVMCSQYVTHHTPDLFSEPNRFNPHRWFSINPNTYEYFPFGAGPRSCLGYTLGMTIIKVSLAMILQSFRLSVIPQTRIDRMVKLTMSPKRGISMYVHRQDRRFEAVPVKGNIHQMVDLKQTESNRSSFPQVKYGKSKFTRSADTYGDAA